MVCNVLSRKGWGLSRPNLNLDRPHFGRARVLRRFEVKFERFFQVGESLFFAFALACNINFQTLGDIPIPLAPDGRGEWSLHNLILSHPRKYWSVPEFRLTSQRPGLATDVQ